MKPRSFIPIIVFLSLALVAILPFGTVQAASTTTVRKPLRYRTIKGADSGNPVSALKVRDQSGSADDPSKYVLFSTPDSLYRGTQDFSIGGTYKPGDVTGISLRVNFKGPAMGTQVWTWKLYDWNAGKWVRVGDNAQAQADVWMLLVFDVPSPQRFISTNGKIRVLLTSDTATEDARIDYEILRVTVSPTPACEVQEDAAFEDQVFSLINAERAKEGIAPLARNDKLDAASQRHSNDMACNNFMSHIGSDGSEPWDRISQAGYVWNRAAENIAAGYPSPASVVDGWMSSDGHRANILDPLLEDIGIAYAFESNTEYGHYWTTDFGTQP